MEYKKKNNNKTEEKQKTYGTKLYAKQKQKKRGENY